MSCGEVKLGQGINPVRTASLVSVAEEAGKEAGKEDIQAPAVFAVIDEILAIVSVPRTCGLMLGPGCA
jgi:hypothetical protein